VPPTTSISSSTAPYTLEILHKESSKNLNLNVTFYAWCKCKIVLNLLYPERWTKKFTTFSTWNFRTQGSTRYCYLNTTCSSGFIHLSHLNNASAAGCTKLDLFSTILFCAAFESALDVRRRDNVVWVLVEAHGGCIPHHGHHPHQRPFSRQALASLAPGTAPRSASGYVAQGTRYMNLRGSHWSSYTASCPVRRQCHCVSTTHLRPYRYRGSGFVQSYRLIAARRLA
jgi:hypothetical protein